MDFKINGKLESATEGQRSFTGCRIEVFLNLRPKPATEPISIVDARRGPTISEVGPLVETRANNSPIAFRASTLSDHNGAFTLVIPALEEIASERLRFEVSSPVGRLIGELEISPPAANEPITLTVEKFEPTILGQPDDSSAATTHRIQGRIIERNGKHLPKSLQVLLLARDEDRAENAPLVPILATKADSSGYFTGEVPSSRFDRVVAVISGVPNESPLRLEESRIPTRVPIIVELPQTPEVATNGDCECTALTVPRTPTQETIAEEPETFSTDLGTGQCIRLNVPNRAIEEFDFYSVVRTTEPDILGVTTDVVEDEIVILPTTPLPPPSEDFPEAPGLAEIANPNTGPTEFINNTGLRRPQDIFTMRGLARPPRRVPLDRQAPVDWDSTPTFYEATSIAHGHLLHFKQVWYADGYSLGDLLYSLPLAPGQKKLISVIDWERREQTTRDEFTSFDENLQATVSRDRDLSEVVTGALSESARGGSRSTSVGVGVGTGTAANGSYQQFNFGALIGVSGGIGESNSSAFQNASRNISGSSMQTLRDRTLQSASAVRSLRSTIIQTARQGEAVRATTEVVANHNHCHALTIQYFEVLRHLKVTHELVDVQECLFVPLPMTEFNRAKALRWRQPLSTYLQRRELAAAFDATRRVETRWAETDTPALRYADEMVTAIFGELTLTILIPLPPFPAKPRPGPDETATDSVAAVSQALLPTEGFLGAVLAIASGGATLLAGAAVEAVGNAVKATTQGARAMTESLFNEESAEERYARFQQEVMPAAAVGFVDQLELFALVGANEVRLNGADFTLVSNYQPGMPLLVSVRGRISNPVRRADISGMIIKSSVPLPPGCRVIVNSVSLRYQTRLFRHDLINDQRVNDDIDLPLVAYTGATNIPPPPLPPGFPTDWIPVQGLTPLRAGNGALIFTPLDEWEQRSPRFEDIRLSSELIEHLNANLEYYHHAIWWTMDPNRRFMLLDGYVAPNAGGRSVASVVDNTLIGIVGNSLVMPVALGNQIDPQFKLAAGATLLKYYDPQSPAPPSRVSLPTRGVFAEAVMGDCNACEEIDDTRFWNWQESPIDEPPALDMTALTSRRSEPNAGTPTTFPTPLVAIQNAPPAPEAAGVRPTLDALTRQPFADMAGLANTQANAASAFSKAMDVALEVGREASKLAQQAQMTKNIGQTMRAIDKAETENKIDESDAKGLRNTALKTLAGEAPSDQRASAANDRLKVIDDQQTKGNITNDRAVQHRDDVLKLLSPEDAQRNNERMAMLNKIPGERVNSFESTDSSGTTRVTTQPAQFFALDVDISEVPGWYDLIAATVPANLRTAVEARGLEIQTLEDGNGQLNLDNYQIDITTFPNRPGTTTRFDDFTFFDYVRKNFADFVMPYPRTGRPRSLEAYESTDLTTWLSADPLGAVMLFTMDPNPFPMWLDRMPNGFFPNENGLVLCSRYITNPGAEHRWNFSTLGGPNLGVESLGSGAPLSLIGNHPVSGTRQFGIMRIETASNETIWTFFVRAADRTAAFVEDQLGPIVFRGGEEYWAYLQNKIVDFVNDNGGEARIGFTFSRRYNWLSVRNKFNQEV